MAGIRFSMLQDTTRRPQCLSSQESVCSAGNMDSIPGSGRSPGKGNDNPLQYVCLENPVDRESGGLQSIGLQIVGHDWASKHMSTLKVIIYYLMSYHLGQFNRIIYKCAESTIFYFYNFMLNHDQSEFIKHCISLGAKQYLKQKCWKIMSALFPVISHCTWGRYTLWCS